MPNGSFEGSMSALLTVRRSSADFWSEAGRNVELAHRTKLPCGWTSWTALVLVPVVTLCLLSL
jgi:hypothetical protein